MHFFFSASAFLHSVLSTVDSGALHQSLKAFRAFFYFLIVLVVPPGTAWLSALPWQWVCLLEAKFTSLVNTICEDLYSRLGVRNVLEVPFY